jgi:branched-chain amino acid transport system ATP-binding protein
LLEVRSLTRRFSGVLAVNDFSCVLSSGEILGLIGPNGAGKSTIFNLISGVLRPHGGQVRLRGERIDGMRPDRIARRGLVRTFQHGSLLLRLSVRDNVLLGATMAARGARDRQRVAEATLDLFGLREVAGEAGGSLPHGIQRLVGMAVACAAGPVLLCLDEPLTGLNHIEIARVLATIRDLRDRMRMSVLFVEHNMRAVMSLCDRIVVINQGTRLADGTPREIGRDPLVIEAYLGPAD